MAIEPIRIAVDVDADPGGAFSTFVDRFGEWWPHANSWSGGVLAAIGIEPRMGGLCHEIGPYGFRLDWGRVIAWEPPSRLAFTWQIEMDRTPQPNPAHASEVEITFEPIRGGTRVTLVHDAFVRHAVDGASYRQAMASDQGWPLLLERYAARVRRAAEAPWEGLST